MVIFKKNSFPKGTTNLIGSQWVYILLSHPLLLSKPLWAKEENSQIQPDLNAFDSFLVAQNATQPTVGENQDIPLVKEESGEGYYIRLLFDEEENVIGGYTNMPNFRDRPLENDPNINALSKGPFDISDEVGVQITDLDAFKNILAQFKIDAVNGDNEVKIYIPENLFQVLQLFINDLIIGTKDEPIINNFGDNFASGSSVEITTGNGDDQLTFGTLAGGNGELTVRTGDGNDSLDFGSYAAFNGDLTVRAGDGNDTLTFGRVTGVDNEDRLGFIKVFGEAGDDNFIFDNVLFLSRISENDPNGSIIDGGTDFDTLSIGTVFTSVGENLARIVTPGLDFGVNVKSIEKLILTPQAEVQNSLTAQQVKDLSDDPNDVLIIENSELDASNVELIGDWVLNLNPPANANLDAGKTYAFYELDGAKVFIETTVTILSLTAAEVNLETLTAQDIKDLSAIDTVIVNQSDIGSSVLKLEDAWTLNTEATMPLTLGLDALKNYDLFEADGAKLYIDTTITPTVIHNYGNNFASGSSAKITTGKGNDQLTFGVGAGINGEVTVWAGDGNDNLEFGIGAGFNGDLTVRAGDGNDTLTFGTIAGLDNGDRLGFIKVFGESGDDNFTFGNNLFLSRISESDPNGSSIDGGIGFDTLSIGTVFTLVGPVDARMSTLGLDFGVNVKSIEKLILTSQAEVQNSLTAQQVKDLSDDPNDVLIIENSELDASNVELIGDWVLNLNPPANANLDAGKTYAFYELDGAKVFIETTITTLSLTAAEVNLETLTAQDIKDLSAIDTVIVNQSDTGSSVLKLEGAWTLNTEATMPLTPGLDPLRNYDLFEADGAKLYIDTTITPTVIHNYGDNYASTFSAEITTGNGDDQLSFGTDAGRNGNLTVRAGDGNDSLTFDEFAGTDNGLGLGFINVFGESGDDNFTFGNNLFLSRINESDPNGSIIDGSIGFDTLSIGTVFTLVGPVGARVETPGLDFGVNVKNIEKLILTPQAEDQNSLTAQQVKDLSDDPNDVLIIEHSELGASNVELIGDWVLNLNPPANANLDAGKTYAFYELDGAKVFIETTVTTLSLTAAEVNLETLTAQDIKDLSDIDTVIVNQSDIGSSVLKLEDAWTLNTEATMPLTLGLDALKSYDLFEADGAKLYIDTTITPTVIHNYGDNFAHGSSEKLTTGNGDDQLSFGIFAGRDGDLTVRTGDGNDTLIFGESAGTDNGLGLGFINVFGESGDDNYTFGNNLFLSRISENDPNGSTIDGGIGFDTLSIGTVFTSVGENLAKIVTSGLDFGVNVMGIEKLQLSDEGLSQLSAVGLSPQDVLDVSDTNILIIDGDGPGLLEDLPSEWAAETTEQTISNGTDGKTYDHYTGTASGMSVELYIDTTIDVTQAIA